jgi:hypothetical protein
MGVKIYSVSLEEEIVEKAKELWIRDHYGKKLSPLINKLLTIWIREDKTKWEK